MNYRVIEVENAEKAITIAGTEHLELICMDAIMPDGKAYEATQIIKKNAADNFIAIIILTTPNCNPQIEQCIVAGADDFIAKPYDITALKAKVHAVERDRKLYQDLTTLNRQLSENDQLAKKVFTEAIFKKNKNIPAIKSWFKNNERFNNDLLLTADTPSNGLNVLFGRLNMEGTAAAVGALTTSETFNAMSSKGYSSHEIIDTLNNKLCDLLSTAIEFQAIFLNFNHDVNLLTCANFGMPEAFITSDATHTIIQRIKPSSRLLGKNKNLESEQAFTNFSLNSEQRIIMTCGKLADEAETETIKNEKIEQCLTASLAEKSLFDGLKNHIMKRLKCAENIRNFSLVEIHCIPTLTPESNIGQTKEEKYFHQKNTVIELDDPIKFDISIQNKNLGHIDPIPTLINFVNTISRVEQRHETLFTIFTELYTNALDHGVLKLESDLKSSTEGFFSYFKEKERRLKKLKSGSINISLSFMENKNINQLEIRFTDSGPGFDFKKVLENSYTATNENSGRGFLLLRNLCDKLEFNEPGNSVRVIFSWLS